jgi:hypothetical protein
MIRLREDVVYREINGEIVAMSLASGEYVAFDAIGSRIWQLIEECGSVTEIKSRLLAEYDLGDERCQTELDAFLQSLRDKQLTVENDQEPRT